MTQVSKNQPLRIYEYKNIYSIPPKASSSLWLSMKIIVFILAIIGLGVCILWPCDNEDLLKFAVFQEVGHKIFAVLLSLQMEL